MAKPTLRDEIEKLRDEFNQKMILMAAASLATADSFDKLRKRVLDMNQRRKAAKAVLKLGGAPK